MPEFVRIKRSLILHMPRGIQKQRDIWRRLDPVRSSRLRALRDIHLSEPDFGPVLPHFLGELTEQIQDWGYVVRVVRGSKDNDHVFVVIDEPSEVPVI